MHCLEIHLNCHNCTFSCQHTRHIKPFVLTYADSSAPERTLQTTFNNNVISFYFSWKKTMSSERSFPTKWQRKWKMILTGGPLIVIKRSNDSSRTTGAITLMDSWIFILRRINHVHARLNNYKEYIIKWY